jgi:hypothetical protein
LSRVSLPKYFDRNGGPIAGQITGKTMFGDTGGPHDIQRGAHLQAPVGLAITAKPDLFQCGIQDADGMKGARIQESIAAIR